MRKCGFVCEQDQKIETRQHGLDEFRHLLSYKHGESHCRLLLITGKIGLSCV